MKRLCQEFGMPSAITVRSPIQGRIKPTTVDQLRDMLANGPPDPFTFRRNQLPLLGVS